MEEQAVIATETEQVAILKKVKFTRKCVIYDTIGYLYKLLGIIQFLL